MRKCIPTKRHMDRMRSHAAGWALHRLLSTVQLAQDQCIQCCRSCVSSSRFYEQLQPCSQALVQVTRALRHCLHCL